MAKYTRHFSHGHFRSEKGSLSAKTSISLWLWLWKDTKPRTKELKLPPEYNYAHRNCNHPYNNFKQRQLSRSWFLWQLGLESIGQGHLITHFFKALQDISYPKNILTWISSNVFEYLPLLTSIVKLCKMFSIPNICYSKSSVQYASFCKRAKSSANQD